MNVKLVDTIWAQLSRMLGGIQLNHDEGLWLTPPGRFCAVGMPFPIDVVFLDREHRVTGLTECLHAFRLKKTRDECASVLELPVRTIYASQTNIGDKLMICSQLKMEDYLRRHESKVSLRRGR